MWKEILMSNRNATASWSGYSHQGKIGILIALKKLNELNLEIDQNYIIDYEQQEDVRLLIDDASNILEVHQVKAYSNGKYISSYTSSLAAFEACSGVNYLHTICEVQNWSKLSKAQNMHGVLRYDYGNGDLFCSLSDIQDKIFNEIHEILGKVKDLNYGNTDYYTLAYDTLLGVLDNKLRLAHNDMTLHPQISLSEILDFIINNVNQYGSRIFNYRKNFYKTFENYIYDLNGSNQTIDENHLTKIRKKIEVIHSFDDKRFEQFLRNINPHTTGGYKISNSSHDEFFSSVSFSKVFLVVLQDVNNNEMNIGTNNIPNFHKDNYYLLTTIDDTERRKPAHARRILDNKEVDFSEYETDYLITDSYSGKVSEIAESFMRNNSGDDAKKFTNPKEMSFISKLEAINHLNN